MAGAGHVLVDSTIYDHILLEFPVEAEVKGLPPRRRQRRRLGPAHRSVALEDVSAFDHAGDDAAAVLLVAPVTLMHVERSDQAMALCSACPGCLLAVQRSGSVGHPK